METKPAPYRAMTIPRLGTLLTGVDESLRWRFVADFLEEYRWEPAEVRQGLLADEPASTGDERWDVFLAALETLGEEDPLTPVAAGWTVREAVDRIIQLGLVGPDHADTMMKSWLREELDRSLLDGCDSLPEALAGVIEETGIGFQVGTDDDVTPGYEAEAYGSLLQEAARCTGGLITIADVEMDQDDESGLRLLFRCNDKPCSWPVESRDEYFDLMAFAQYIDDLNAPPRVWDSIDVDETEGCDPANIELRNFYFFGEPGALRQLASDFGIKLFRLGD